MRKFGIASLLLLVAGLLLLMEYTKPQDQYSGSHPEIVPEILLYPNIVIGVIIAILLAVSSKSPRPAGTFAIWVSLPGMLIWGIYMLVGLTFIFRNPSAYLGTFLADAFLALPYLASAICLCIAGAQSINEADRLKAEASVKMAAIETKQENTPKPSFKSAVMKAHIFGTISLILLVTGIALLSLLWMTTPTTSIYPQLEIYFHVFIIIINIIVGIIIVVLISISSKKPHLTGFLAILLSIFGIIIWGFLLILAISPNVLGNLKLTYSNILSIITVLAFFTSAITLFIGGILSIREDLQAKAAVEKSVSEPKQENAPE